MLNSLFSVSPQHAQVGSAGGTIESKNNNRVSDLVVDSCVEELSVQHCFSSAGWTEHQQDKSTPPQHKPRDCNTNMEFYLSPWASFKQPGCTQTSGEQVFYSVGTIFSWSDTVSSAMHLCLGTQRCRDSTLWDAEALDGHSDPIWLRRNNSSHEETVTDSRQCPAPLLVGKSRGRGVKAMLWFLLPETCSLMLSRINTVSHVSCDLS